MKITFFALALVALLATVLASAWLSLPKRNRKQTRTKFSSMIDRFMIGTIEALVLPVTLWRRFRRPRSRRVAFANVAEGVHRDSLTRLTDAAITTRHLLYKKGSDDDHIAVSGVNDVPIGTVDDEATAAEEYVAVQLLAHGCTKRMVASEAIGAGVLVYAAASGKIATTGTQCVGVSLTAASTDGDIIEVNDVVPPPSPGVAASLYDAHTILYATTDNTPAALTVAASRIVGRASSGNIVALTPALVRSDFTEVTNGTVASAADSLAIPVTKRIVTKTTGADAEALTLANGVNGQKLCIVLTVDGGGDGTLTPTTKTGFATIVFADAGDTVDLEYVDDTVGWIITGTAGVSAPPVITV